MSRLDERVARAATWLGVAGVLAAAFVPTRGLWRLVAIDGTAAIVTVALGLTAIAGARLANRLLVGGSGVGYLAAALLQLAQANRDTNWLGGNGSTFSFFGGLGIGLLIVAVTPSPVYEEIQ